MKITFTFVVLTFFSFLAHASVHTATLVFKKGQVQFLNSPRLKPHQSANQVLFAGKYYKIRSAKLGRKIHSGDAVKVGPNGQAKLTFNNGDQFIVGPGSTYTLENSGGATSKAKKKGDVLKLFYGKMRGIVSKKGPRKNLKIKTRGTVAGVRGTDFFVSSAPDKVRFTVLRGKVAVEKAKGIKKALVIDSGMSANVPVTSKKGKATTAPSVVKETTKGELLSIQKASQVNVAKVMESEEVTEQVKKAIKGLEVKAKKVIVEDIKTESKEMAKKIDAMKDANTDKLNSEVIYGLYKKAPVEKKVQKLEEEDLTYSDDDIYKKYFEK